MCVVFLLSDAVKAVALAARFVILRVAVDWQAIRVCASSTDMRHVLSSQVNSVNNDGARGNPERGPMPTEP